MPDATSTPTRGAAPIQAQSRPRWLMRASHDLGEPCFELYRRRRFLWFEWWQRQPVGRDAEAFDLLKHLEQPDVVVWNAP